MSLHAAYLLPGKKEPADGDSVASTLGWQRWADWVLTHAEQFPEAAHLAQEGWLEGGEPLADLEHELERLLHEAPDPDRSAVTAQVLAALRARPEASAALMVTDGDDGGGDESEVAEAAGSHEFAAVMVPLSGEAAEALLSLGKAVADSDLAGRGREDEPHVTARYGLHAESVDEVAPLLRGLRPVRLRLTTVSVFPDSGNGFDVLKADVESDDLVRLHEKLGSLPHTDTHPVFRPHATIAYVRPGRGAVYAARFGRLDVEVLAHKLHFGGRSDGVRGTLPLEGVAESDDEGDVWEGGTPPPGKVIKEITVKRGGKTFTQKRLVNAPGPAASKPVKADPAAVAKEVHAALAAPEKLTTEAVQSLTAKLKTLTVEQIKTIQKERGRGAAGGRDKAARVQKLIDHARAKVGHRQVRSGLDAMGIGHSHLSDDQAAALHGRIAKLVGGPKAGEKAAPAVGGPKVDASEKELRAAVELDGTSPAADETEAHARAAKVLAKVKAGHSPAEIRELARRVTGKAGRSLADAEARLIADMTAVTRLVRSQDV